MRACNALRCRRCRRCVPPVAQLLCEADADNSSKATAISVRRSLKKLLDRRLHVASPRAMTSTSAPRAAGFECSYTVGGSTCNDANECATDDATMLFHSLALSPGDVPAPVPVAQLLCEAGAANSSKATALWPNAPAAPLSQKRYRARAKQAHSNLQ